MISLFCPTEEMTRRLGFCLGARLRPCDVVLLRGEMGAGKSVLARAAARGMGVAGAVPSPTFTILNVHEGRDMRLYHFDLYRLEGADALYELGLDEYIPAKDGATLIEWPQMAEEAMPETALVVELAYGEDGEGRRVTLTPQGDFDGARLEGIDAQMEDCHEYPDA